MMRESAIRVPLLLQPSILVFQLIAVQLEGRGERLNFMVAEDKRIQHSESARNGPRGHNIYRGQVNTNPAGFAVTTSMLRKRLVLLGTPNASCCWAEKRNETTDRSSQA